MSEKIRLVECPRDAMQGWNKLIPTQQKIAYLQQLLTAGFDTIDCGSFVSPKAIPQLADTREVLNSIDLKGSSSRLLVIVANERGALQALEHDIVGFLGFPFSISPTFQQRNANSSIEVSFERVKAIQENCVRQARELVIYISMAFGNPYGDPYHEDIVFEWTAKLAKLGINIFSLADTVGLANAEQVFNITDQSITQFSDLEIGVHLHAAPTNWKPKLEAAMQAGCSRFDGAIKGIGGCPMAGDALVGNMNTGWMIDYFEEKNRTTGVDPLALQHCSVMADSIFTA